MERALARGAVRERFELRFYGLGELLGLVEAAVVREFDERCCEETERREGRGPGVEWFAELDTRARERAVCERMVRLIGLVGLRALG